MSAKKGFHWRWPSLPTWKTTPDPFDGRHRGTDQSAWFLRRADQVAVATFVVLGLAATIAWCILRGGLRGGMVELERAEMKTARFEVDVNTADWPELLQLPEIGETLAKRIVDSRRTDGPFRDQRDLMRVRGIGPKTFNTIRPYLRPMPDQGAMAQK